MSRTWEGIPLGKRVAELNMHPKMKVTGCHTFATCLKSMGENPCKCKQMKCVIGLLIHGLLKRGAKL